MSNIVAIYIDKDTKIVLTTGIIGDFAAYEGPHTWSDEKIAAQGNKRHDEDVMRNIFCLHIKPESKYRH